jgi:hypothetical protein
MKKQITLSILSVLFLILATTLIQAISVRSVTSDTIYPGKEGSITVTLRNDNSFDIEDVSMALDLSNSPFSATVSSEASVNEILEGKTKSLTFYIKANSNALPGDYNIPYTITYEDIVTPKKGTLGISISGKTDLEYTITQEENIIGNQGKIGLKIINKGTGEAKFVDVKITPQGFTLLSEPDYYIGTIDSDDYQTATFDVIYNKKFSVLNAIVTYEDFDNNKKTETIEIPLKVYTQEEAINLGIIKRNNSGYFILIILIIIIVIILLKRRSKQRRLKKSELMMR